MNTFFKVDSNEIKESEKNIQSMEKIDDKSI